MLIVFVNFEIEEEEKVHEIERNVRCCLTIFESIDFTEQKEVVTSLTLQNRIKNRGRLGTIKATLFLRSDFVSLKRLFDNFFSYFFSKSKSPSHLVKS